MELLRSAVGPAECSLRSLREAARARHLERCQAHGFSPDVDCSLCGDTGCLPNGGDICDCAAGVDQARVARQSQLWQLQIPIRFRDYRLDSCPNVLLARQIRAWLDADPIGSGQNLVIRGDVGVGKTGAAIGALHALFEAGRSIVQVLCPDLFDRLRSDEMRIGRDRSGLALNELLGADCLLLDDLGEERSTEFTRERWGVLVEGRYVRRRPLIITTNLDTAGMLHQVGNRALSRIMERVVDVQATGPDLRGR